MAEQTLTLINGNQHRKQNVATTTEMIDSVSRRLNEI